MKFEPQEIDDVLYAFPATVSTLMPKVAEIPDEFLDWNNRHPMSVIFRRWMFHGLPNGTEFVTKDGIDSHKALRHISTIMRSFEPKHEHKEAACSYLMSLWFSDVKFPEVTPA